MVWILNSSKGVNMTVEYEVNMTVEYEGKEYYAEEEQGFISCKGCVFNQTDVADHTWCSCEDPVMIDDCYTQQIVWKEVSAPMLKKTKDEEPKFTVKQVLLAAKDYTHNVGSIFNICEDIYPEAVKHIEQCLMKQNEPEYQLYLQLKQKYEQT